MNAVRDIAVFVGSLRKDFDQSETGSCAGGARAFFV